MKLPPMNMAKSSVLPGMRYFASATAAIVARISTSTTVVPVTVMLFRKKPHIGEVAKTSR